MCNNPHCIILYSFSGRPIVPMWSVFGVLILFLTSDQIDMLNHTLTLLIWITKQKPYHRLASLQPIINLSPFVTISSTISPAKVVWTNLTRPNSLTEICHWTHYYQHFWRFLVRVVFLECTAYNMHTELVWQILILSFFMKKKDKLILSQKAEFYSGFVNKGQKLTFK